MTVPSREEVARRVAEFTLWAYPPDPYVISAVSNDLDNQARASHPVLMGYDHDGTPVYWEAP